MTLTDRLRAAALLSSISFLVQACAPVDLPAGSETDDGFGDASPGDESDGDGVPDYLDDLQDLRVSDDGPAYPRTTNTGGFEALKGRDVENLSKYTAVSGVDAVLMEKLHAKYPKVLRLRYASARAYQAPEVSMPLADTWPGHWLFFAGTVVTKRLGATGTLVTVEDASRIHEGEDVMIYQGNFERAEHARVSEIDTNANTVRLVSRGFRSTGVAHDVGSIIATHGHGAVEDVSFWAYNGSTACPLDPGGKRASEVLGEWLGAHVNDVLDADGITVSTHDAYDGILWDISGYDVSRHYDVDNDLAEDGGIIQGINTWGEGMDLLFAATGASLEAHFPATAWIQVGGTSNTRGFALLHGDQLEGFPIQEHFDHSPPDYRFVDEALGRYAYFDARSLRPTYSENRNKVPTAWNPQGLSPAPESNAPFRLALGLTLLGGGYFSKDSGHRDDWWDEYAVDGDGNALDFFASSDQEKRDAAGWLGRPLGARKRLVSFPAGATLLTDGGFEGGGAAGWTGSNVTVTRVTGDAVAGSGALRVSRMVRFDPDEKDATAQSPKVTLPAGEYTLSFAMRADSERQIGVALGGVTQTFMVNQNWSRRIATFELKAATSTRVTFEVGRESVPVVIDEVYLFAGNADVFRRDFEHGAVLVNATGKPVTIDLEDGVFRRIRGGQDSEVNSGKPADSVNLPARDGLVLFRR